MLRGTLELGPTARPTGAAKPRSLPRALTMIPVWSATHVFGPHQHFRLTGFGRDRRRVGASIWTAYPDCAAPLPRAIVRCSTGEDGRRRVRRSGIDLTRQIHFLGRRRTREWNMAVDTSAIHWYPGPYGFDTENHHRSADGDAETGPRRLPGRGSRLRSRHGLELVTARHAQQELLRLQGKVKFSKTWQELKDDRYDDRCRHQLDGRLPARCAGRRRGSRPAGPVRRQTRCSRRRCSRSCSAIRASTRNWPPS